MSILHLKRKTISKINWVRYTQNNFSEPDQHPCFSIYSHPCSKSPGSIKSILRNAPDRAQGFSSSPAPVPDCDHCPASYDGRTCPNFKYTESCISECTEVQNIQPPHWTLMTSSQAGFPCRTTNFSGVFTDHHSINLWSITKSLAPGSTCTCLNHQRQAAILQKTGSIWISKCPWCKEEGGKE